MFVLSSKKCVTCKLLNGRTLASPLAGRPVTKRGVLGKRVLLR